ncbi:transmembrane 220 family protein [Flaviaesturariibacter amylovorans]|uniref:Transmembrane family 220, helix n=1 Tax=Flaviaesturariibacter amylovorans TaxID=1084520 RepID=A0ABP8HMG7_9BACT
MLLSIINIVFFLAFVLFAYFNFNDSDAWLWVSIYMAAAICCALAVFSVFLPRIYMALGAFYLAHAFVLFFAKDGVRDWVVKYRSPSITESMKATKPYIEKTREFFGLLIITAALLINYLSSK